MAQTMARQQYSDQENAPYQITEGLWTSGPTGYHPEGRTSSSSSGHPSFFPPVASPAPHGEDDANRCRRGEENDLTPNAEEEEALSQDMLPPMRSVYPKHVYCPPTAIHVDRTADMFDRMQTVSRDTTTAADVSVKPSPEDDARRTTPVRPLPERHSISDRSTSLQDEDPPGGAMASWSTLTSRQQQPVSDPACTPEEEGPLFKRVGSLLARREEERERFQRAVRAQELAQMTFHPRVDAKSDYIWRIRHAKNAVVPVYERLHRLALEKRGPLPPRMPPRRSASVNGRPLPSSSGGGQQRAAARNTDLPRWEGTNGMSFFERMVVDNARRRQRLIRLHDEVYPTHSRPPLDPARATRLYDEYVARKPIREEKKEEPEIAPPALSAGTRRILRKQRRTFKDLIACSERRASGLCRIRVADKEAKDAFALRSTSLPRRSSLGSNSVPGIENIKRDFARLYNPEAIQARATQRNQNASERLREREQHELKECTFHPVTTPYKPPVRPKWPVDGVDKFMQRVLMMRHMETAQRQREQRAFGLSANGQ